MPVKMPDLPKHQSEMPLSVGRTKVELPDALKAQQQVGKAAIGVGNELVQYQDKIETEAADTEATKRATEYEASFKKRMYGDGENPGVKYQDGDPTPVYQQFDSDMDEEFKRLTNAEDLSPRARHLVTQRVTDRANQLNLTRLSEQGAQSAKYEDNVHTADIEQKKTALPDATTYIKPGDDSSFAPYDDLYAGIRNSHVRRALKLKTAVRDDNGSTIYHDDVTDEVYKVSMSPQAQVTMNKDLSEGTYNAMNVLIKSGHVDKANALNERYGASLDPVRKANLADDFERANIDQKGYMLAAHPEQKKKWLAGLDEVTAIKVEDKARSLNNTRQAEIEQAQNRVDKRSSEALGNMILERNRSEAPYVSVEQAMQDPKFSMLADKIKDPTKKQALYDAIEQPKKTVAGSMDRVMDLVTSTDPAKDVRKMSYSEINQELSGLDSKDRTWAEGVIQKMKTETGDEQKAKFASGDTLLKAELLRLNVVTEDDFNRVSGDEFDKLRNYRNQLIDVLDKRGPMTAAEVEKTVRQYAASVAENKAYSAEAPNKFQGKVAQAGAPGKKVASNKPFYMLGSGEAPTRETQALPATPQPRKRSEWNVMFQREFKSIPTPQQLDTYIKKNGG